jgi:HTH-type transcriptional regulator, sugar sensing transcriptional regulator
MIISENTREILREMGLNAYETDAYIALLEHGQRTAMEISRDAHIPYSKIYEALNSMKEKGWIKSSESRPFKYYPVPPLEAATSTKLRLEDKYQRWENFLAEELQPLYEKRELVERPDMLILRGHQAVLTKMEEVLKKATKEVMIAAPEFARVIVTSAESLFASLKKTTNVKLMVAGKTSDWLLLKKIPCVNDFRVREHMFGGGIIADGKEAMLFLGEDKPSLVIWSNHLGLVRFAREYFQFLWDSSDST